MKRLLVTLLILTTLSGCLVVPFALPTISHRPSLQLDASTDQILVLCATKTANTQGSLFFMGSEKWEVHHCQLLKQSEAVFDSQTSFGYVVGYAGVFFASIIPIPLPILGIASSESMLVLYRPGYQMIHLQGWSSEKDIKWVTATQSKQKDDISRIRDCVQFSTKLSQSEMDVYNQFILQERKRLNILSDGDSKCVDCNDKQ